MVQEATELGKRAKEIKDAALGLQREERAGGKGRKWKKNVHRVQQVQVPALRVVYCFGHSCGALGRVVADNNCFLLYIKKIMFMSYICGWPIYTSLIYNVPN